MGFKETEISFWEMEITRNIFLGNGNSPKYLFVKGNGQVLWVALTLFVPGLRLHLRAQAELFLTERASWAWAGKLHRENSSL